MSQTNQAACDMLRAALEMEKKGKDLYDKFARSCRNKECREIFETLARDEVLHMKRINQIYDSLSAGEPWCDDWKEKGETRDPGRIFTELVKKHAGKVRAEAGDMEALEVGIELEDESIGFYRDWLDKSGEAVEKDFLRKMVAEEKGHHAALIDMKLYLADPSSWFSEKERSHYDGA